MEITMKKSLIFLSLILLFNCKDSDKRADPELLAQSTKINNHPGKKLMEINCYACHNPTTDQAQRIAPPMIAVKKHYKSQNTTKEQFIADMQEWIKKPSEERSKMPGAIRNFGLMPYAPFPEETISQIAEYIYDYDIEQPEWFEDHYNQERGMGKGQGQGQGMGRGMGKGQGQGMGQGNGRGMKMNRSQAVNSNLNYEDLGLKYALSTKAELGRNLMGAIQKKGVGEAVTFCNERAYFITDSMARFHNAIIKRVSDKPRNQNNKANSVELVHIETFKNAVANKMEINPIVEEEGDLVNFYYPITTNSMCLQCHGTLHQELKPETYKTIKGLYPNDKGIGYDVNEVRGIWSITFDK